MNNSFTTLISGILAKIAQLYPKKSDVYTKDDVYTKRESDAKIKSAMPTKLSMLQNDRGYITADNIPPTSWNDLEDKPFGMTETVVISGNTTASSVPTDGEKWSLYPGSSFNFVPIHGTTYLVRLTSDDAALEVECIGEVTSTMGIPHYKLNAVDTSLGFSASALGNSTSWSMSFLASSTSLNWKIDIINASITYLDEMFIPDVFAHKEDINWDNLEGKPFGETVYAEYIKPTSYNFTTSSLTASISGSINPTYPIIYFDGIEYAVRVYHYYWNGVTIKIYGNVSLYSSSLNSTTNEPVAIAINPMFPSSCTICVKNDNLGTHTIGFSDKETIKINSKFLPDDIGGSIDLTGYAKTSDVQTLVDTAITGAIGGSY